MCLAFLVVVFYLEKNSFRNWLLLVIQDFTVNLVQVDKRFMPQVVKINFSLCPQLVKE